MWELLSQLAEHASIIVTIAFLITRLKAFRQMINEELNWKGRAAMIGVFGLFGVIGNYSGIVVNPESYSLIPQKWSYYLGSYHAIADTRNIGILVGGLLGGPAVGVGAGLIAGGHRYLLGGFINMATFFTSVLGGLMAGWVGQKLSAKGKTRPWLMLLVGLGILIVQISLVPLLAKQHEIAFKLIQFTGPPIIIVNGIGIWICAIILSSVLREEERARALQTQKALFIADETLQHFRQGLHVHSCSKAAEIIFRLTNADGVAITEGVQVLAHAGRWRRNHVSLLEGEKEATRSVLETGKMALVQSPKEWDGHSDRCPMKAGIILPLTMQEKTVGTLILYFIDSDHFSTVEQELAEGLAKLFSAQLELGEAERHRKLLQDARMKALNAQIHPHFLFNSINTIVALCRTDAMLAQELLIHLGTFLRNNLQGTRQTLVSIEKEMENVEAYLAIERARFPGRYALHTRIDEGLHSALIPPFTIQPLVENAIRHGFPYPRKGGTISIQAEREGSDLMVTVSDNGTGIPADKIGLLGKRMVSSAEGSGTAIENIRARLSTLFGSEGRLHIESEMNKGTRITIRMPLQYERGKEANDESLFG